MHAHPDGQPLALADSQQSVAPAVSIDAAHDLEINPCATYLRLLVAAGFAMTLLSASLAFDWRGGLGDYDTTVGYAGVALFGLVTSRLIWMLPAERGSVVIVTPSGIRDLRIGNEFLLQESIAEVSTEPRRDHRMIVLTSTPALQRQLARIRARIRSTSRGAQDDRIVIHPTGWRPILTHCCAPAVTVMLRATHAPHCGGTAIKVRQTQVRSHKAWPYKRHKAAAG